MWNKFIEPFTVSFFSFHQIEKADSFFFFFFFALKGHDCFKIFLGKVFSI